jgi:phenylpyruvate tautomerase PptA (4-oxalocrotonate tautomerase family)
MTMLISIDRSSLGKAPLVLSGSNDANALGITDYTEPSVQARVRYAPDSDFRHGSTPLGSVLQQTIVGFAVCTTDAVTESESRALVAELTEAVVGQFRFTVTITIGDAPAETWACHSGAVVPVGSRNSINLRDHDPEWSVTIPAHPVRTVA